MSAYKPNEPDAVSSGGPIFEFVDEAHEVTDEERNRPRYGRPVRNPASDSIAPRDGNDTSQSGGK
jgi:hypothetical protein